MQIQLDNLAAQIELLVKNTNKAEYVNDDKLNNELQGIKRVRNAKKEQNAGITPLQPTEKELKTKIAKALNNPPPKKLIPPLECGALSVQPLKNRITAEQMLEQSEKAFNADYESAFFKSGQIRKKPNQVLKQLNDNEENEKGVVYEKDLNSQGALQLIQRGQIPKEFALDELFEGNLQVITENDILHKHRTTKEAKSPSHEPFAKNSLQKPLVHYASEMDEEEVEQIISLFKQQLKQEQSKNDIEKQEGLKQKCKTIINFSLNNEATKTIQPPQKFHWTQFGSLNYKTKHLNGYIQNFQQQQNKILFHSINFNTIPIMRNEIIQNIQYKALLQKYDFMRHQIIFLLNQIQVILNERAQNEECQQFGLINCQKLIEYGEKLFFGEIQRTTLDIKDFQNELFQIEDQMNENETSKKEDKTLEFDQDIFEVQKTNNSIDDVLQKYFDFTKQIKLIQNFFRKGKFDKDYLKQKEFVCNIIYQQYQQTQSLFMTDYQFEVDRVQNILCTDATEPNLHRALQVFQLPLLESYEKNLTDSQKKSLYTIQYNIIVFCFEGIPHQILKMTESQNVTLIIVTFQCYYDEFFQFQNKENVKFIFIQQSECFSYLQLINKSLGVCDFFKLEKELYGYIWCTCAKQIKKQLELIEKKDFIFIKTFSNQLLNKYYMKMVMELQIGCVDVLAQNQNIFTYSSIFLLSNLQLQSVEVESDLEKYVQKNPQPGALQVRFSNPARCAGQDLVHSEMGGRQISYIVKNVHVKIFQTYNFQQSVVLQSQPRDILCYLRIPFFYSNRVKQLSIAQLKKFSNYLLINSFQSLEATSYVFFEKTMSYGEIFPAQLLVDCMSSAAVREGLFRAFNEIFSAIIYQLNKSGQMPVEVNIGVVLLKSKLICFNGISFGSGLLKNEVENILVFDGVYQEQIINQQYIISFNNVFNLNSHFITEKKATLKKQLKPSIFFSSFKLKHFSKEQMTLMQNLQITSILLPKEFLQQRQIQSVVLYDIYIQESSYKAAIQRLSGAIKDFQQFSGNEETIKQIVALKQQMSVQAAQQMLEFSGTSAFCNVVCNMLLSRFAKQLSGE